MTKLLKNNYKYQIFAFLCFITVLLLFISNIKHGQVNNQIERHFGYIYFHNNTGKISSKIAVSIKNQFWQEISPPGNFEDSSIIYVHNFYYDNRSKLNGTQRLLSFVSSVKIVKDNLLCLIWIENVNGKTFKILRKPATVISAKMAPFFFHGKEYVPYQLSCECPSKPKYVSLAYTTALEPDYSNRSQTITNLFKVIFPKIPQVDPTKSKKIGICCHGIHGDIKLHQIPYVIQWIELARIFGASEITLYNVSATSSTSYFDKLVEYYSKKGILSFNRFPPLPPFSGTWNYEMSSQALVRHTSGDCLLRNLHRYWYVLYIDMDEIVVPRNSRTYQDFLTDFLQKNKTFFPSMASIVIRSAYHYYNVPKYGSNDIPSTLPVLKYNTRTLHESIVGDNSPYSKSFVNPRVCDVLWQHRCLHQFDNAEMANPKDILVHHYRNSCPPYSSVCKKQNHTKLKDSFLMRNYGDVITQKTKDVLKSIQWREEDTEKVTKSAETFTFDNIKDQVIKFIGRYY